MQIYLIILLFVTSCVFAKNERVNITVYYESYCSDSARFFTRQLKRAYIEVKNITSFKLIPFGKATVSKLILKCFLSF